MFAERVERSLLFLMSRSPAWAAVRGMSYQDLLRDPDFTRAVKTIAEQCSVNVDIAKLKCQGGMIWHRLSASAAAIVPKSP